MPSAPLCREEILQAIEANQVILVAGQTGCGKTTQVPQYILEEAWGEEYASFCFRSFISLLDTGYACKVRGHASNFMTLQGNVLWGPYFIIPGWGALPRPRVRSNQANDPKIPARAATGL